MPNPRLKIVPDPKALTTEAAHLILAIGNQCISAAQSFSLFLSGGNTPKAIFEALASPPCRDQLNWSKVEIFFGDERCVPPDHPDSNYNMASAALLSKVPIPAEQIHRMRGELDPHAAAIEYGRLLKTKFPDSGPDLNLLGMGDDGHTASLFPGTDALNETQHRCVANFVPKLNTWRITLTYPFLNTAKNTVILLAGPAKAARLAEVLQGPSDPNRLPIQGIHPTGSLTWLIDQPAAALLKKI